MKAQISKESKEKEEKKTTKVEEEKEFKKEIKQESLIRIVSTDIPARLSIYAGLTKIKGISWSTSAAICKLLNLDKNRKVSTLTPSEIDKITEFLKNPSLPSWLLNRRNDIETGENKHLITTELDLRREFDIRKMKKMKSYKGVRHILGQPVRGQRTKSHFRKKGHAIGVMRTKKIQPPAEKK